MVEDQSFVGCEAAPPLKHWLPVLEEWLLLVGRCSRVAHPFVPWHFMERTNASLLGSAACRCGWIALSERFVDLTNAAADLVIYLPDGTVELVEAKFGGTPEQALTTAVSEAASRNPIFNVDRRVGVAFVLLDQPRAYDEQELFLKLERVRSVRHAASAWYFPTHTRNHLINSGTVISPGIVLLAQVA
jgi:hypothetical protein